MLDGTQFLHILTAESELLVDISICLINKAKGRFKRQWSDAFTSDDYSGSRAVQEAIDQHLILSWYEVVSSVVAGGRGYSYYPLR